MAKQQIKKDPDRIWFIVNKILLGIFFLSVLGFAFMLLQNVGVSVDSYEPNNPRFSLNLASLAKTGESFLIFIFLE